MTISNVQDFYHAISDSYDEMTSDCQRWERERDFLASLLKEFRWQRIMDAGCGTGGEAITLASLGATVAGVDATFDLLETAREKAAKAGVSVEWFHDDLRVIKHPTLTGFDAVFCRGNTLPHLLKNDDLKAALTTFKRIVHPGGHLVLGWLNYHRIHKTRERLVGARQTGDKLILRFYDFQDEHLIFNLLVIPNSPVTAASSVKPTVSWHSTTLKPWTFDQVQPLLAESGWSVVGQWGGSDRSLFDEDNSTDVLLLLQTEM